MTGFQESIDRIHCKRRSLQDLSRDEFALLLADTIMDRGLFSSPHWNWRYGGVRYVPRPLPPVGNGKILVLQWPGSLGDVCMAAPFLSVLRQRYPGAEISFLSSRAAQEVFSGSQDIDLVVPNPLDPYLDRMLSDQAVSPGDLLTDIRGLAARLAGEKYDLVVNLQILPMSAAMAGLIETRETVGMTLSGDGMPVIFGNIWAPYLFGVSVNLMRRFNPLHRTEIFRLMVDEEQNFTPHTSLHISTDAVRRVQEFLDREGIGDHEPLVGLNPMSGTPVRQWPHFDQLAGMLRDNLGARVMIFGSKAEDREVEAIVSRAGKGILKATHFNLQELMAAISGCDLFIANDTGPMHLACLLGRKVIALFGPTAFREVGPWETEFHVLQSSGCRDCFKQSCSRPQDYCMERIRAWDVADLACALIQGGPNPPETDFRKSGILYASPEGFRESMPDLHLETHYGQALLKFLGWGNGCRQPTNPSVHLDPLLNREYENLKTLALKGIQYLGHPSHESLVKLSAVHQGMFKAHPLFQPVVAFNDFMFLDKRLDPGRDPGSFRRFHKAVLRDLERLMHCLTPSQEERIWGTGGGG